MFLENDFARPLFDFEKGGPPQGFKCLMNGTQPGINIHCGKVTRTEQGMRMHLKQVHNWKEQPCLYSTDNPTDQKKGEPRKLKMFTKENIAATTKRSLVTATEPEADHQPALLQLTEPETRGENLPKPTKEEK